MCSCSFRLNCVAHLGEKLITDHSLSHSLRSASIGSNCAALLAGYNPAAMPHRTSDPSARAADHGTSRGGSQPGIFPVNSCCNIHMKPAETAIPIKPLMPVSNRPSQK